jgi:hypothetical protein
VSKRRSPKPSKKHSSATTLNREQLSAIQEMRALLLEVGDKIDASNWTREHAAEILYVIAEGLSPLIDMEVPNEEGDFRLFEKHSTTEVLGNLADALRDIKDGKVVDQFKPPEGLGGAGYSSSERAEVHNFLAFVDWVKGYTKMSYPNAEKSVANTLKTIGTKFRGKPITATNLRSWRRAKPGVKRRSQ